MPIVRTLAFVSLFGLATGASARSIPALILPYAVRVVSASLTNLRSDIEEAAVLLGSSRRGAFFRVVLPSSLVLVYSELERNAVASRLWIQSPSV